MLTLRAHSEVLLDPQAGITVGLTQHWVQLSFSDAPNSTKSGQAPCEQWRQCDFCNPAHLPGPVCCAVTEIFGGTREGQCWAELTAKASVRWLFSVAITADLDETKNEKPQEHEDRMGSVVISREGQAKRGMESKTFHLLEYCFQHER